MIDYRALLTKQMEDEDVSGFDPSAIKEDMVGYGISDNHSFLQYGRAVANETHQRAELQLQKNRNIKSAFGIADDYVEGSVFTKM